MLSDKNNRISVITFSQSYNIIKDIKDASNGWILGKIYNYQDNKNIPIYIDTNNYINNNTNYYWGYINYGTESERRVVVNHRYNGYLIESGIPSDSDLLVDFTSDKNTAINKIKDIGAGGGTDAESALDKVQTQLEKIKDSKRGKYVIFFTDGLDRKSVV